MWRRNRSVSNKGWGAPVVFELLAQVAQKRRIDRSRSANVSCSARFW
jgi:hypothetical protein